jgi:hypothetical protein
VSNELSNYCGANRQLRLDDPGSIGAPAMEIDDHLACSHERGHYFRVTSCGDLLQRLLGEDLRVRAGLLDSLRIIRPVRGERRVPSLAEKLSQLLGNSQRPWTKTTGVLPAAFAASI